MSLTTMKSYLFLRHLWILWILLAMPLAAETARIYVTNRGGTTIDVIDPKTNKVVHVLTTGADVIHSFAVPAFGIKIDAIPGRINETWFKAEREGIFYGQCSELCGKDHAFMPITVRVVNDKDYTAWIEQAKKKFATDGSRPTAVAAAGAAK